MKLYVKRDQEDKKGIFGGSKGVSFILGCRLELDQEEKNLIEKYKQWEIPVYSYENTKGAQVIWSLKGLCDGKTVSCDGVPALLHGEEEVKNACSNIKLLLAVMKSFGGEEVVEI